MTVVVVVVVVEAVGVEVVQSTTWEPGNDDYDGDSVRLMTVVVVVSWVDTMVAVVVV